MARKNRIRELREARGWSLEDLAARCVPATTRATVHKLERGNIRLSDDWRARLARALECAPWDLLPLEDRPPVPTDEEAEILNRFRGLSEPDQQKFVALLDILARNEQGN